MAVETDDTMIDPADLHAWTEAVLRATGASEPAAAATANALLSANRRGLDSHGVEYLYYYLPKLRSGVTPGDAQPQVALELPALAVVDGNAAMGAYAATYAMALACVKSADVGASVVAVRNSSHFGAASAYAELAAERGCIGIAMTNSDPAMAPEGALAPVLGTNPIAIAAPPGSNGVTPSLDMAASLVAFSRVIRSARAGEAIPADWAIGPDGRPTEDANAALENSVVPFGAHKGFALAFMIDVLAGCLSGGSTSQDIVIEAPDMKGPQGTAHLFIAIHLDSVRDRSDYVESLDRLIESVHGAPTASWADELLFPGEPEHRTSGVRRSGIPLRPEALAMLRGLGAEYGLAFPL